MNKTNTPLRDWRKRLEITQKQAATMLTELRGAKIAQAQISKWESGGTIHNNTKVLLHQLTNGGIDKDSWPK